MDHSDWNERYAAKELVWGSDPNRFVAEALGSEPAQGRALDLACGEGRNAIWLAEQGWRVTAVDFSQVAIGRAQQLSEERGVEVEWVCEDLKLYRPEADAFALVLVAYLQIPGPELESVLARASAALAPGGQLLMIGHARRNLAEGVGGPRDPAVLWTPDEIEAVLSANGLDVERCEHVRRPVDSDDGPREAIDVLARARRQSTSRR